MPAADIMSCSVGWSGYPRMMMRKTSLILLGAAAGVAVTLIATQPRIVFDGARAQAAAADTYRQLSLFGDVFERVRADYVEKPDDSKLIESAINGMLAGLDPHSGYMDSKSFQDVQVQTRGEFGGLGIEVTMEDGLIKVVAPIDETPAAKAGIMANDVITHLDDEPVQGLTLNQAGDKLKGYVIDLRNNPGGLLDQAISVSDAFLERGEIVSTRGRNAEETQRFNARAGDLTKGKPIIILVNGGSASASEIVAGALQDHKRATIIGTRSFGKGSVQTIIPLGSGNGALRLTTARYFTPSGKSIQAKGIVPDIEVLQDVPDELKSRTDTKSEASLRGHLKSEGDEKTGSQSYVPPDAKDDKALKMADDLLHGVKVNASAPATGDKAAIDKPSNKEAN